MKYSRQARLRGDGRSFGGRRADARACLHPHGQFLTVSRQLRHCPIEHDPRRRAVPAGGMAALGAVVMALAHGFLLDMSAGRAGLARLELARRHLDILGPSLQRLVSEHDQEIPWRGIENFTIEAGFGPYISFRFGSTALGRGGHVADGQAFGRDQGVMPYQRAAVPWPPWRRAADWTADDKW